MSGRTTYSTDELIERMKSYFGDDERRIAHALAVLDNAKAINAAEGADSVVVEAAAVLHDIGIHEAERKHGSSAGNFQEIEGPPIAAGILAEFDLPSDKMEHVLKIIANHHSARDIDTLEFRALWDADWLVNIPDEFDLNDTGRISRLIEKVFKTNTGGKLAAERFLQPTPDERKY